MQFRLLKKMINIEIISKHISGSKASCSHHNEPQIMKYTPMNTASYSLLENSFYFHQQTETGLYKAIVCAKFRARFYLKSCVVVVDMRLSTIICNMTTEFCHLISSKRDSLVKVCFHCGPLILCL